MPKKGNLKNFIIKANSIHNKYDYSKSIYINSMTKLEIWMPNKRTSKFLAEA